MLFLVPAFAGCASPDGEESNPPATDSSTTDPEDNGTAGDDPNLTDDAGGNGTDDSGSGSDAQEADAFVIEDLRVVDEDGNDTIHEDDRVTVSYAVRNPDASSGSVTRFVSLAIDGEVVSVDQVTLAPGESKAFDHELGSVRGRESVVAEVRVAPARERVEATVVEWPRTGEQIEIGPLSIRVNRWLKDIEDNSTLVNTTFAMAAAGTGGGSAAAAGDLSELRANILCVDASGAVTVVGEVDPDLPETGASGTQDVRLPECEERLYGVRFTGRLDGERVEQRVLFVERGWQPPASGA